MQRADKRALWVYAEPISCWCSSNNNYTTIATTPPIDVVATKLCNGTMQQQQQRGSKQRWRLWQQTTATFELANCVIDARNILVLICHATIQITTAAAITVTSTNTMLQLRQSVVACLTVALRGTFRSVATILGIAVAAATDGCLVCY